ncbi:MAG: hypothetical protein R3F33_12465 [Planctomycetota bacterium]
MSSTRTRIDLRGVVHLDQLQPQVAATIAANSDGFFPVAGESSCWVEVQPGLVVNRLMDVALKSCEVTPGALVTERHYGTLEVHGPDQGQVVAARRAILAELGCSESDQMRPTVLIDEVIRKVTSHHAMLINRTRAGMLLLSEDTLYTLEVTPAVHILLAANVAEKTSPIRIVGLGSDGAVGRLRLAGNDAEIDMAVEAVRRTMAEIQGRKAEEVR